MGNEEARIAAPAGAEDLAKALTLCAAGDRQALHAIYQAEGGRMIAVAARILRRRELAEEATQDAMLTIWSRAGQYAPDRGSAQGWIYAILRNRALTILRKASREEPTEAEEIELSLNDETLRAEHDATLEALDRSSRLRACLERLDETKRRCVLMAYLFGYTHGEIAGRLEKPLGTVKSWINRGLASLRACLS